MHFVPYRQASLHNTNPNPLNRVFAEEGRPIPTNEAEKILEILKPVVTLIRSWVLNATRLTFLTSPYPFLRRLAFGPRDDHRPVYQKLEAERLKRAEEKKGQDLPKKRSQRSESVESNTEPPDAVPNRGRKIGKLTSSSSRAKVSQGRKGRSVSVNEEDSNDILENSTTVPSGRQNTKSGRLESKKTSSRSFQES
ncbi:hypothetical protein Pst134EA_032677 [Puccinia striiformis f. sp. tritici]|uniref:uncharacterized protein n=1 Tax=Puccinia striiformis f. sp. tritici TaxID=168172 RepID=UPI002008A548|nr:uncharacterized protein Pst134EA_032677 [Puccinia striiformis f. sp. tritici]KAH9441688.1 hypothetical protein Pst134EA_032677 [Puccinia striiformis f. sp. tritici]